MPFLLIHRLADLGELAIVFKFISPRGIAQGIAAHYFQLGVVAPFIGIADLVGDGFELHQGLLLGVGRHPGQIFNVFAERRFQSLDHLHGA